MMLHRHGEKILALQWPKAHAMSALMHDSCEDIDIHNFGALNLFIIKLFESSDVIFCFVLSSSCANLCTDSSIFIKTASHHLNLHDVNFLHITEWVSRSLSLVYTRGYWCKCFTFEVLQLVSCAEHPIRDNIGMWPAALNYGVNMTDFSGCYPTNILLKLMKGLHFATFGQPTPHKICLMIFCTS